MKRTPRVHVRFYGVDELEVSSVGSSRLASFSTSRRRLSLHTHNPQPIEHHQPGPTEHVAPSKLLPQSPESTAVDIKQLMLIFLILGIGVCAGFAACYRFGSSHSSQECPKSDLPPTTVCDKSVLCKDVCPPPSKVDDREAQQRVEGEILQQPATITIPILYNNNKDTAEQFINYFNSKKSTFSPDSPSINLIQIFSKNYGGNVGDPFEWILEVIGKEKADKVLPLLIRFGSRAKELVDGNKYFKHYLELCYDEQIDAELMEKNKERLKKLLTLVKTLC